MTPYPTRPEVSQTRPYVPGKSAQEVEREYGVTDVVRLSTNENPLGPSPLALAAIIQAGSEVHIYPDPTAPSLRRALAARTGLEEDWIFIGSGSDEILRLLASSYISPGDRVVVPDSSYPNYAAACSLFGARVETVPLKEEAMDLDAMADAATGSRLLFLCRPNNPTGAVFPEERFRLFMERIEPRTLVLLDEAYHEYDTSSFNSLELLHTYPNLILTRTFSKAHGLAGLRIGYGMARPEIWAPLLRVREPFSVNAIAQAAALAALEDHAHLDRTLAVTRQGKSALADLCREIGLRSVPSEANFVLIDLGRPAEPVHEALLRQGVIVRPCGGVNRPTCLRVTIGTPEQISRFAEALRTALKG